MWNYIIYSLRLRRVEYRVAELPIFFIPVLLTISESSQLASPVLWEGLVAFLFLFAFGDLLNCLADRDLDSIYKPHLTQAVDAIGTQGVIGQAIISALGALGFTSHIAWMTGRWALVPMAIIGLVVAWAYSVEPVRLKRRGAWQLLFYWLGLFLAPMTFAACLFANQPALEVLVVCAAFAFVQTGVILVNTAEDFPEDRQMNVRTAVIALGLRRGIYVASWLAAGGSVLLVTSLIWIVVSEPRSVWQMCTLLPLLAALVHCAASVGALSRAVGNKPEESAVQTVKLAAKRVPIWMTTVALSTLLASVGLSPLI